MSEKEKLSKSHKLKQDLKNTTVHVVLKKKTLDNGDLSKYIPSNLKTTNLNSKNQNTEKRRVKPLTITQKNEKEEKEFVTSFNSVKSNQDSLNNKLKNTPFSNSNKNVKFNPKQRLPKTLDEIEENEELVKLLLKNPNDMTPEEKFYISSLNKEEFKRFIEFLKRKNRELSWRGNDLGSGRYLNEYINIYRDTGHSESERFQSLQKFLKLNHDNGKAEKANKEISYLKKSMEGSFIENYEKKENDSSQEISGNQMTRNIDHDMVDMKNKAFEATSKVILNELEKFKNIILSHKNEAKFIKIEVQNKIMYDDLEKKAKVMRDDVNKIKEMKDNSSNIHDIDKLYEKFKNKTKNLNLELSKHIEESSSIKKINSYLKRMNLSAQDLVNKLDDDSIISSMIDLNKAKETLLRLKILDENECDNFLNTLRKYHGNKIKVEYFLCILESYVFDDIKDIIKENVKLEEEEQMHDDDDYDYYGISLDYKHQKDDKLLSKRVLQDFDFMMKKKAALLVQRLYKGYRARKEFKVRWIYENLLAKRITIQLRRYAKKLRNIKNESAHKITYLMRKHYINKSLNKNLSKSTQKWLKDGKNLANLPFSHKNKVRCAIQIQRAWRRYKDNIMKKFFDKNSSVMDMNMLKTKTCFICLISRVSYKCGISRKMELFCINILKML
jgi:hypothetical protein